jgi:hypothetical protein
MLVQHAQGAEERFVGAAGRFYTTIDRPQHVVWVPADGTDDDERGGCVLSADGWSCSRLPAGTSGVVVLLGNASLRYAVVGPRGVVDSGAAAWGRMVRLDLGTATTPDPRDVRIAAWRPERSPVRSEARKLTLAPDSTVRVHRLSVSAYWVTGTGASDDSFLNIEYPGIASERLDMAALRSGSPDVPVIVAPQLPLSIVGRVELGSGEPAGAVSIGLDVPVAGVDDDPSPAAFEGATMARYRTTTTDAYGTFEFPGLGSGTYHLEVSEPSIGRGDLWTKTPSAPVLITLKPPLKATGRVLQRGLPLPMVRVRFVPDADAWASSIDPASHVTIDVLSDDAGRFSLPLPAIARGVLQFIAPDGTSARVALSSSTATADMELGDVALGALRPVTVRLTGRLDCHLMAVGPVGSLGVTMVRATGGAGLHWFDLPEPGTWLLNAECAGRNYAIEPPAMTVAPDGPPRTIDARLAASP